MIVSEILVRNWLKTAVHGQTLVYARVTSLPVQCAVARRMRYLAQDGHVILYRTRREHGAGDENFHYVARRTGKPLPGADAASLPCKPQDGRTGERAPLMREIAGQVRGLIAEGASHNATAIARELGIYSSYPVRRVLERLAA